MTIVYKCDSCGETFLSKDKCTEHELKHLTLLNDDNELYKYLAKHKSKNNICECCENSYLVYGCELDCTFKKGCLSYYNGSLDYPKFVIKSELKEKWIKEYNLHE